MHIKKVVISGFKSYLHTSNEEQFSKKVNAIVGINGSGKSNFFEAIRFVLSESLTNLRAEERQQLLFERSGQSAFEAQVAIHFDNTDRRITVDKDEVVIRRVIGRTSDGYYCINDKRVTKKDIVSLLESAGFSRSNPYYIVQQGKVNHLTLMKDKERLNLLKEVAGTRVYEEKKIAALKLIEEGDAKREKSKELLAYIEERLAELEEEKEELEKFDELDKKKRSIEYNLYQQQLQRAEESLEELDDLRDEEAVENAGVRDAVSDRESSLKTKERDVKQIGIDIQTLIKEKNIVSKELQEIIAEQTKLELRCQEQADALQADTTATSVSSSELKKIEQEIQVAKKKLGGLTETFQQARSDEMKTAEQLGDLETRLNGLYAKMGRSAQYSNAKERDVAIQEEVKSIRAISKEKATQKENMEASILEFIATVKEKSTLRKKKEEAVSAAKTKMESLMNECSALRTQRDTLANQRKELWRQDASLEGEMHSVKEELTMNERSLYSTVDRATSNGLQAVRQIAKENNIRGYYGPLIDLFECPDALATAVEVTAGNALFFVVVDTDETASRIIDIMNAKKAGRVTFMPLNRLHPTEVDLPRRTDDYFPLLSVLKDHFQPRFQVAMQQIFGRTLLCRTLEVASSFARTQNIDCVTEQGDKINKKGALTGGFYDVRESRCQRRKEVKKWQEKWGQLSQTAQSTKKKLETATEKVRAVLEQVQVAESKVQQVQNQIEELLFEIRIIAKDMRHGALSIEAREKGVREQSLDIHKLGTLRKELENEMATPFQSQLSSQEKKEVETLNKKIVALQNEYIQVHTIRAEAEAAKDEFQSLLDSNLLKQQEELHEKVSGTHLTTSKASLASLQSELRQMKEARSIASRRNVEMEGTLNSKTSQLSTLTEEIEALKEEEYDAVEELQMKTKQIESLFNKRSLYLQQREENLRKIRELGSLPSGYAKFSTYSVSKLMKLLHTTNEGLRKYSNVNKKALDQWKNFTKQKKDLRARMIDLTSSKEAIDHLIQTLDQQKDEAICLTLKGVSAKFRETFKQLVPQGRATLSVVIGSGDTSDEEEDEEEDRTSASYQVRRYQGVSIEAAFTDGEPLPVELLSGGQKSVTALALIFAIQKCDPAPFYLFDEIDAALDPVYRTAVANMVLQQANVSGNTAAQFIVSTFKAEFLQSAEKFFAIRMEDRGASTISEISKEQAEGIIEQEAEEMQSAASQSQGEEEQ